MPNIQLLIWEIRSIVWRNIAMQIYLSRDQSWCHWSVWWAKYLLTFIDNWCCFSTPRTLYPLWLRYLSIFYLLIWEKRTEIEKYFYIFSLQSQFDELLPIIQQVPTRKNICTKVLWFWISTKTSSNVCKKIFWI